MRPPPHPYLYVNSPSMATFLGAFVLPLLLLAGSILDWNLISFINLISFFAVQFTAQRRGFDFRRRFFTFWFIIVFSLFAILVQIIFNITWLIEGNNWAIADAQWAKLVGFVRIQPWGRASSIYFVMMQFLAGFVAFLEMYHNPLSLRYSFWWGASAGNRFGSRFKVAFCLLLPGVQLVAGISHPSWICLPFFICSCVGLVDWSLTSNFLGLFRWWKSLLIYACFSIVLFYLYQLPVQFPKIIATSADFIGLYRISTSSDWPETTSVLCLLLFYYLLSSVKCDLEEMDSIMSMRDGGLTEQLIPSNHSFFIRESRSGVKHTNVLLRGSVFRNFSINFFTYGFPVVLLALSSWSFTFASICAFGLLAYVGYILYAFPSLFHLHKLNGLLLVFILLWAASTYVFNIAFTLLNKKIKKDMEIWETIGLWHYPIPGFFLLAQFFLGVLVAIQNLVNNSVFLYLSDKDEPSSNNENVSEVKEDKKVLIVATVAWGLHKISRAIALALIFLLVMKPGIIHAIYMVFFLIYLLSHSVSQKIRQALIVLCEVHFMVLYILQLDLVSKAFDHNGSVTKEVLLLLGLQDHAKFSNFVEIGALLCFCAVQNHGFKMLFSFSAIVENTPCLPFGFSILKAGLNKSVLLSVYASSHVNDNVSHSSSEQRIAAYLNDVEKKCLSIYRSHGTYVAILTILFTVYLVNPNYISFGYLFLLLFWILGRQLVEKTKRRLWLPLKMYASFVFFFTYSLSSFSTFKNWVSAMINLPDIGFNPQASLLENVWESLAVLIVMQLYSYERRKSRQEIKSDLTSEIGFLGFLRRLLIWHSEKILSITVFYAALSPISAFGIFYLLGLVVCSTLPKASRFPSKFFLVYTGILVMLEYLFQLWGTSAQMFPGQKLYSISLFLGFRLFGPGFWGLESGFRGKVLVIIACTLQYNVFHWLEMMPICLVNKGKWEDPCVLFVSMGQIQMAGSEEGNIQSDSSSLLTQRRAASTFSWPSFLSYTGRSTAATSVEPETNKPDDSPNKFSFGYIWGSSKESHKWNKKRIVSLRKERLENQKAMLKMYLKFWTENAFRLFGLEINMIALLLASFALLNVISLFYIFSLLTCILLKRHILRKVWAVFVLSFSSILILEYFAMWKESIPWIHTPSSPNIHCHDCWRSSNLYVDYCQRCWLGIIVDDPRMLVSYYLVFIVSSFKLRSDHMTSFAESQSYLHIRSQRKYASVFGDLSFETKGMWTVLDYLRLYSYCHLLDIVLALILITGTLEYDILHLGYLGFALVFFRMRLEILKRKNEIFKYLRIYNFVLIVLSLAYQSPYLGDYNPGKCETIDYIYEVIGFYKYAYGFRITSRSALVEIVIFLLVAVQSYIFCSREFDHVSRYLEAEQIGAIVREQEKKAAWKMEQLQHIRKSEEKKRQRHLQVEKMKTEMLSLQSQVKSMNSMEKSEKLSSEDGLHRNKNPSPRTDKAKKVAHNDFISGEQAHERCMQATSDRVLNDIQKSDTSQTSPELLESPGSMKSGSPFAIEALKSSLISVSEIIENEGDDGMHRVSKKTMKEKSKNKENPLLSAVQLIGDGVSQVQSLGNQAVTNIVSFLNIEPDESDSNGYLSAEDGLYDEIESQNRVLGNVERSLSVHSGTATAEPVAASLQLGRIFRFIWTQMRSNNDVVCYCCFVIVFLWDFSLLSMVYLAALFLYALCVNSGPSYLFWVIMLIYTEVNILLRYLYQIIIQHCGLSFNLSVLQRLGFSSQKITSSFVISTLPLFLVYLSTLLQRSITAKDGEWESLTDRFFKTRVPYQEETSFDFSWSERIERMYLPIINLMKIIARCFSRYWISLTQGSEAPPYFVQILLKVEEWPVDGIQPERIESGLNQLLTIAHEERCHSSNHLTCHLASRIRIQSIERSKENSDVALAVFEVVYASPLSEFPAVEWYSSLTPAADVAFEIQRNTAILEEINFPYQIISVIGGGKREIDLYAYTFGADLAVFFLVAMFYQSVIKNNSQFLDVYQLEDQFPKEFVFVLMVLFFLIVLDRVIYLCSFATGKLIFYLFNLFLFTYSVTVYAWYLEPAHQHTGGLALRAIYLTKAISLALQALQIRHGLPHKSTLYRQFLTSTVSQVNFMGFRLYRALPFLYELRCVLDWSCTTTSLTMYDWLKLEDINASLFLVKCDADLNHAGHQRGEKQTKTTKFCSGICLFFILICVIWAPMLMYSSGNPTNIANPIMDVTVQIDLKADGGRLTLYQTSMCEKREWESIASSADLDPDNYLDTYNEKDIQLICCQADSSSAWLVPNVVLSRFVKSLNTNMQILFYWIVTRDRPKGKEVVKYESALRSLDAENVNEIKNALNGTTEKFLIRSLYHRYFRVTGSGDVRFLEQTENSVDGIAYLNQGGLPWWSFHDVNVTDVKACDNLTGPMAIVVSEETPQGILGETLSKFSIWSLYLTFVLAVGRFIRLQCSDLRMRIPYENLPSCERLIEICEDIYAARAEGELEIEEVLYWTLVEIYRSPHKLLEYTKPDQNVSNADNGARSFGETGQSNT